MNVLGALTLTLVLFELSLSFSFSLFCRDFLKFFSSSLRRFSQFLRSNGLCFGSSRSAVSGKFPTTCVKEKKIKLVKHNQSVCSIYVFQSHAYIVVKLFMIYPVSRHKATFFLYYPFCCFRTLLSVFRILSILISNTR